MKDKYYKFVFLGAMGFSLIYNINTSIAFADKQADDVNVSKTNTYDQDVFLQKHKYSKYSIQTKYEIKDQAVNLARQGNYERALAILKALYESDPKNIDIAGDYLVVLNWNGEYNKVVNIYENNKYENIPSYVLYNVASAYYRLGFYDKAVDLLKMETSDIKARKLLANIYLLNDDFSKVEQLYAPLIKQDNDAQIYEERATVFIDARKWSLAVKDLVRARELANEDKTKIAIDDKLAICYLHLNDLLNARKTLESAIESHNVTSNMVGNYIILLNRTKEYHKAIKIYKDYFASYAKTPTFILRELMTSYMNLQSLSSFEEIYDYLRQHNYNTVDDDLFFAHTALKSSKYQDEALSVYANLLQAKTSTPAGYIDKILEQLHIEGKNALAENKLRLAEHLYALLISTDKRYYSIYASDLIYYDKYKTAERVYKQMESDDDFKIESLDGLASVYMYTLDYSHAKNILDKLSEMTHSEYEYSQSAALYKDKQLGQSYIYAYSYGDSDDGSEFSFGTNVEQYIDNNLSIQAGWNKDRIKDVDYDNSMTVKTKNIGLKYNDIDVSAILGYSWYDWQRNDSNGLNFSLLWNITDDEKLSFEYLHKPLFNAEALNSFDKITTDDYTVGYEYNLNPKMSYHFTATLSNYSDDNEKISWELGQNYLLYDKNSKFIEREIYYSKEHYKDQSDIYYSPKNSENVAVQWSLGRDFENGQMKYIGGLGWSRDYPEDFYLSPFLGLEYDFSVSDMAYLSCSMGYTWSTDSWLGKGSWKYDNRYANISYNIVW